MGSVAEVGAAETSYEVARFASRQATTPASTVRVIRGDDGYHVSERDDVGPAYPSLLVALDSHPELLVVTPSDTTVIRSSELKDWEIGERLVVDDIDKLDNIPELSSTGLPTGNGWPLDLLCRVNDVEWWYFQPTDEAAGFFVPDDFDTRDDVEEVAHFYWTFSPEVGDCGDRLERLGSLYRYWNTLAIDYNGDGNDRLYRSDSAPREEAMQFFGSNDAEVVECQSVDLASPYLSDSELVEDYDTENLTINGSPWIRNDTGEWEPSASSEAETVDSADGASQADG